jgi:primosomal protein N' (replication factor Y)
VPACLVAVAVPVPSLGRLTYRVPADLPRPVVGARVTVPLGTRHLTGIVLAVDVADEGHALKDVTAVLDTDAFLPPDVVALAVWVADYYLAGPGAALSVALPPHGLTGRTDAFKTARRLSVTPAGLDLLAADEAGTGALGPGGRALSDVQRQTLRAAASVPDGVSTAELEARGGSRSAVARLRAAGLLSVRTVRVERDPFVDGRHASVPAATPPRVLTDEQASAFDAMAAWLDAREFTPVLLHGVTGSGKTELYLRLAERARAAGRQALVLVPEIALTPQVAALFRSRFGDRVAIQHSALADGERHDQWHRIRAGEVDVVVGTRSAVFAPCARLGLLIVDEEHDSSYKQDETPRYHGRDVAVVRARTAGALVVLGSATPSLESYANARAGRYQLVRLARRVLDRPMAEVRLVSMREEMAEAGGEVIVSRALREALQQRLDRREQAMILLNRRGYAAAMLCRQCGHSLECPQCSVSLAIHRRRSGPGASPDDRRHWAARCHYCNYARGVPSACPQCAAPYLEHVGIGTDRVEAELRAQFPDIRMARVDRDTVRRRGSLVRLLERFARRELDVLVGTQMIAKGHDFPDVTLVGVISADVGLGLADFRAAERTFQLLTQVAGRAGRGERRGEAIIQTLFPTHYSITLARTHDYEAFYDKEVAYRHAMRYPPQVAMVNVVVKGRTYDAAMQGAQDLAAAVRTQAGAAVTVMGPAPAPLARLRGDYRAQFFLKGTHRPSMGQALRRALEAHPDLARRATLDVDPLTML